MKIFQFKTNILKSDKNKVGKILNQFKGITWKMVFENMHNILKVEDYGVTVQKIISAINAAGFECKEL